LMALFFDRVSTAQLVERPHWLAVEGARNAESVLPCAILVLSVMLVVLSIGRRHLEMAFEKQAGASKHHHVGTTCSPSALHMLCQELDNRVHMKPKEQPVPSLRSMKRRSTRLRERMQQGSLDCCLFQIVPACEVALQAEEIVRASGPAPSLPCCEVTLQADEVCETANEMADKVVQASKTHEEVVWVSEPAEEVMRANKTPLPVPSSEEPRSAADASGISNGSDFDAPVAAVCNLATDAGEASIEAPPGLSRCHAINMSIGDVVEGTSAAKVKGIAVGGWPQTLTALRSARDGNDHSTSGPDAASSSAWGCSVQQVYSNSLLLAHRSVYLKISQGAPGLLRIQDPSPASVWGAPQPKMPNSVPAHVVMSCGAMRERVAIERHWLQTQPLFHHDAHIGAPCTKLTAGFKRSPSQHRFALQRHGLKPRSVSVGPAMRSLANRRVALDVLGPPPSGSR